MIPARPGRCLRWARFVFASAHNLHNLEAEMCQTILDAVDNICTLANSCH